MDSLFPLAASNIASWLYSWPVTEQKLHVLFGHKNKCLQLLNKTCVGQSFLAVLLFFDNQVLMEVAGENIRFFKLSLA